MTDLIFYHATINGFLEVMQNKDIISTCSISEINNFIKIIKPLIELDNEWLKKRLEEVTAKEGFVYVTDSLVSAENYTLTYPEIIISCIIKFKDLIKKQTININEITEKITTSLLNLYAFYKNKGKCMILELKIPADNIIDMGLGEFILKKPIKLSSSLIKIHEITEEHLFFFYYNQLKEELKERGVELSRTTY